MQRPVHRHPGEVSFADTDASGWMHFPNAFRFVEAAEHAFLRARGIDVFATDNGGWPRVQVWCDFEKPLRAGDPIEVILGIARVGSSSVTWEFEIRTASGERAAHGSMTTVRVDTAGNSRPLDEAERAALA